VDWRFLLPDPNLGQVAYIGPAHGSLPESLRRFSAALTLGDDAPAHDDHPAQFDIVVAQMPSRERLREAVALVRPNGFLYVEVRQRWAWSGWRSPAALASVLRQCGFVEVEAYWHWPNFDACAEIVPLGNPAAVRHALGRRRSGRAARVKSALGRALSQLGLLARLVPCFSIVARKRAWDEGR
jgi:SAM-dependent methyltransferase